MHDKICVMTGSNNGFALVAAERLSRLGAKVVMVVRSRERGERACELLRTRTRREPDLFIADLELQRDVRRVASEIGARYPAIDVLVNNAGFAFGQRELTAEGFERTFALNYLTYFTMCHALRPQLRAANGGRVINTASSAHRRAELRLDNLQSEVEFGAQRFPPLPKAYAQSNVARIMLTYELAERWKDDHVTANCFCPGLVMVERAGATPMQNWMSRALPKWLVPQQRTPEAAAEILVFLASSPDAAQHNGVYFERDQPARSSEQTYDRALRAALWEKTEKLLSSVQ
jgi:NAD(P)-dependent dehydrogenase (short-subunit alcohol dehydrogenase family)